MKPASHRPSPAAAVAFLALLVALSGTAVALPGTSAVDSGDVRNNSIRSKDVRNNDLRGKDIRNGSIGSRDVKNGALRARDFRAGELPAGPPGAPGATGPQGAPGTAVAYATIDADGLLDPERSMGITQAHVDPDTIVGSVCFTDLPFTARSAMVAAQTFSGGAGQPDVVATSFVSVSAVGSGTTGVGDCSGSVLIRTFDISDGALADRPFHVWFED